MYIYIELVDGLKRQKVDALYVGQLVGSRGRSLVAEPIRGQISSGYPCSSGTIIVPYTTPASLIISVRLSISNPKLKPNHERGKKKSSGPPTTTLQLLYNSES